MMKKKQQTDQSNPAENKNTVTGKSDEEANALDNTAELNSTNKAYSSTSAPGDDENEADKKNKHGYENWGSEFGADPEAAGKINATGDENENVSQGGKDADKDLNSR